MRSARAWAAWALIFGGAASLGAQTRPAAELRLRIVSSLPQKPRSVPAVIWLDPLPGTPAEPFLPAHHYELVQKNRAFIPHLLIVPVGSAVTFPNEDPFYHNVFSLFEGKRFDLGLYEAGSERTVTFSRSGVSYIFCNIHPEMSAVVIALRTPLYAIADSARARPRDPRRASASFRLRAIPPGKYELHVWVEGVPQAFLDRLSRPVRLGQAALDLGRIAAPIADARTIAHTNLYGRSYAQDRPSPYGGLLP